MEQLLYYVWKHKLFPLRPLVTSDGRTLEVIDPGLLNRNAGPDFFNAKVKIDGTLWVGNVEIHGRTSDWYLHRHDQDRAYDNVVLHVAEHIDGEVTDRNGRVIPQLQLPVPPVVSEHYRELLATDSYPPCHRIIPSLPPLTLHSWMAALQTERLERKTGNIERRAQQKNGSWEDAYFVTLARSYGFGINSDAFEQWALNVPLQQVAHHRDDLFQVEALFLGQAGLLNPDSIPQRYRQTALQDAYYRKIQAEYAYLSHKFRLTPLDYRQWRFLRLRPQNFPHIRISQLARLYFERRAGLSVLLECQTIEQLQEMFKTHVTPYWETHYTFGSESAANSKRVSPFSINLLLVNTAIPVLFAYGKHTTNEKLCERAFDFLDRLKAENNAIIRQWKSCGMEVRSAGDSQALIQLKTAYCDKRECLRCRIGFEYLKATPDKLVRPTLK